MPDNAYDRVPYSSYAYVQSAPDNLATLATLFGMHPAPPDRCRVLEIGCAAGGNLGPLALLNPHSTYLGIDLSAVQVEAGREAFAPFELSNLELRQLDVMDIDASLGAFDYIVSHGVYSWVPDAVQDRILAICRDHLAPHGVAYVSYNTYPGWHLRGMIRDMMLYHTAHIEDPERKVLQARALLQFLREAHPDEATTPYAVMLRAEAETLELLSNAYLFHDHLSEHNTPVYFHQFVDNAARHGLGYLGESRLSMMLHDQMPDSVREVFSRIAHDQIKTEQYMDFVRNRTFRQSLLVHDGVDVNRQLDWRHVRPFRLGCHGTLTDGVVQVNKQEVRTDEPLLAAAFEVMIAAWPKSLAFEDLLARSRERCGSKAALQHDREELGGSMLRCFGAGVVEARLTELPVTADIERPNVFTWTRAQIAAGQVRLTNARHESGDSDELIRTILFLCDGQRDQDQILDALVDMAAEGGLVVWDEGERVSDRQTLRAAFEAVLPSALRTAVRMSMVVE